MAKKSNSRTDPPAEAAGGEGAAETEAKHPVNVRVEDVGPCKKKLIIEIPAEEIKEALSTSLSELTKNAVLPGFRRGHAPVELIEKRFGTDIRKEVKSNLVVQKYQKALEERELEPIAEPDVDIDSIQMQEDQPLKYEVAVEVWPEFEAAGYEGMKLEKPPAEPTPEEIEAEISALRMRTTSFEEVTADGAQPADFCVCDYTVTAEGKEIASIKDIPVRPEDGVLGRLKVAELKDALLGKKPGETVNLTFKIAEDHEEEAFRGKEASLSINMKGIRRPHTPEATEEWAKDLGFESLEELKTVVSRNVGAAKEARADGALRGQVYDKLVDMLKFDLPEDAVRRQQKNIFRRERQGLQYRGVTEEDLAKINDKLEEASLEKAQKDLKLFFILSKIAEKEKIQATDADVEMRIAELAARYRTTTAKMREHLKREDMLAQLALEIREEKTVAHILSKAEVSQAAGEAREKKAPKKPRVKKTADEPESAEKPAEKTEDSKGSQ